MVLHHEENIDATGLHLPNIPPAGISHHAPPHSIVNETLQFRLLVKFKPSQNNARFPLLFDNTQVLAYADSGSTRSLVSSALLTRLRGSRATQDLLHKRISFQLSEVHKLHKWSSNIFLDQRKKAKSPQASLKFQLHQSRGMKCVSNNTSVVITPPPSPLELLCVGQ